jgi:Fe-Mn family superoxide dismutase
MPFELPELPYAYDALEPSIDARTMEIHHTKHHQAYTNNLNAALAKYPELADKTIEELLGDLAALPEDIRETVRNNGGGWHNHVLFFLQMTPSASDKPTGPFAERARFTEAANSCFGSGWAWFALDQDKKIQIYATPNQDSPLMRGHTPLIGVDVWEHAYYLKYKNRRSVYVDAALRLIDWDVVNARYEEAMAR